MTKVCRAANKLQPDVAVEMCKRLPRERPRKMMPSDLLALKDSFKVERLLIAKSDAQVQRSHAETQWIQSCRLRKTLDEQEFAEITRLEPPFHRSYLC